MRQWCTQAVGYLEIEIRPLNPNFLHTLVKRYTPEVLPDLSKRSGVKIVVGTATYVDAFLPEEVKKQTVEQVSEELNYILCFAQIRPNTTCDNN